MEMKAYLLACVFQDIVHMLIYSFLEAGHTSATRQSICGTHKATVSEGFWYLTRKDDHRGKGKRVGAQAKTD